MNPLYVLIARAALSVGFLAAYAVVVSQVLVPGADFSPAAEKLLTFLLGALTTSVVTVVNFWFSSTQGSADKSVALAHRE